MTHPDSSTSELSAAILEAPAWARVGISVRDPRLRSRAAETLVAAVLARLEQGEPIDDANQLALPI